MAYRHRVLEHRLRRFLELFPAVAVTGPRQSGKSTLLRKALPDFPYVSFDDPEEVRAAERDPRGFLARYPDRVVLDEAQKAPELFSFPPALRESRGEDRPPLSPSLRAHGDAPEGEMWADAQRVVPRARASRSRGSP